MSQQLVIDVNKERVQRRALTLAQGLIATFGEADAVAVLVRATEEILTGILHTETPVPEANAAAVDLLLTQLQERVMMHRDCMTRDAEEPMRELPKAQVH